MLSERGPHPGRALSWLVGIGVCLRLIGIGHHSLWFDEAGTLLVAEAEDPVALLLGDRHPPLTHLLFRSWIALVGTGDAALRLLPASLSCIGLLLFVRLARDWLGRDRGIWAVGIYALSPLLVWNAQEVRMYTFVEVGSLVALLGASRFVLEPRRRRSGT